MNENNSSFDKESEIALIKEYQAAQDPTVKARLFKRIRRQFDGAINQAIKSSGADTSIGRDALIGIAQREFKRSIDTYDDSKNAAPATRIIGNISGVLSNHDRAFKNPTRVSDADTIIMGNIENVKKQLFTDGIDDPTDDELSNKIMESYGKVIPPSQIAAIRSKQRNEYSGNKVMSDNDGEDITFGEQMNVDNVTPEEQYENELSLGHIDSVLSGYSDTDGDFYRRYRGIGKYKETGPTKISAMSGEYGFPTEYFAKRKADEIDNAIRERVINYGQGNKGEANINGSTNPLPSIGGPRQPATGKRPDKLSVPKIDPIV